MGRLDHLKDRFEDGTVEEQIQAAETPEIVPQTEKVDTSLKARLGDRFEGISTSKAQNNLTLIQKGGLTPSGEASAYKRAISTNMNMNLAREAEKIPEAQRVFPKSKFKSKAIEKYMGEQLNNAGVSQNDEDNLLEVEKAVNNIYYPRGVNVDGSVPINFDDPEEVEAQPTIQKIDRAPEFVKNLPLSTKSKIAFDIGRKNLTLGRMRYNQIFGDDSPDTDTAIEDFKKTFPTPAEGENFIEDVAIATSSMTPLVVDSLAAAQEEGIAAGIGAASATAIAGQVGPQVALPEEIFTVPGAFALGYGAGTTFGASKNIFEQEAGLMYDELLNIRDENGNPIDKTILKTTALGYATISTVLEMIGLKYIARVFPGGQKLLGKFTKEPVKKLLRNPSIRKSLLSVGKKWVVGAAGEGITEGSQQAASLVAKELAKWYSSNIEGTYFLPFDWANAFREVRTAGYFGIAGGFGFGGGGVATRGVVSSAKIVHDINQSKRFTKRIEATKEATGKTETAQLSPDHAERFVNKTELPKEGFIEPDEGFFQSDLADEILIKLGVDPREARKQFAMGQDISVSNSKVMAQLTEQEFELVKTYLKPQADTYSERQVNEQEPKQDAELLKEDYSDLLADDLEFGKELDRFKAESIKAGLTQEIAEANTQIVERFANGLALQGADRTAFLKSIQVQKVPFAKRIRTGLRGIFGQVPIETAEDLSIQIATLETRIAKIDPNQEGAKELIEKLEAQKARAEELLTETALEGFDIVFQGKRRDPKAQVVFGEEQNIIQLFENADPSSLPHELGHVFLRQMSLVEATDGITDQFKADMSAVREWLGVEEGITVYTTEQQEQFARGWEKFLLEGTAPNKQLETIFLRFQRWLTEVYKTLRARNRLGKLTPEIRGVFNRMLDADTEVQSAAAVHNMIEPTTERMNELGISNDEQIDIKRLVSKAIDKASNAMFRAQQRAIKEARPRFIKEAEQEIRAEDRPGEVFGVYDLIDDIKENKLQFSRQEYNEAIGNPNGYKFLPAKNLTSTKDTAQTLDDTALRYGFESADTFVEAIATTLPFNIAVQNRVAEKIQALENTFRAEDFLAEVQEYSDFIQIWNEHLRNEEARTVTAEITGRPRKAITNEQMKAFAQDRMQELSVREAQRTDKFLAAMKRAAVAMRKAERAKDYAKAIRENEKMQLNKELAAISVRNKKQVNSFVNRAKKFRKLGKPASISLRYREGVRDLINRFSILPNVAPQRPVDMNELLKGDEFTGEFIPSEFLLNPKIRDYRNISMLELTELDNMMKFLTKIGREEQTGLLSDGVTKKDEVVKENVEEMETIDPIEIRDRFAIRRKVDNVSREFFANLLGLPYITKALGGYKALKGQISSLETWITERLKDIEDARLRKYDNIISEQVDAHAKHIGNAQRRLLKEHGQKIFDSGVPVPEVLQDNGSQLNYWTPEQIFSLAFNRGNQSNIDALTQGYRGLTIGQIDTLLNKYLTPADMDAVQGILDAMESLFNETDATHVKMRGYHIKKVEAQEWTFKGKTYRGGYYPLAYDRILSDWIASQEEVAEWFDSEEAKFTVPYASFTHTMERKKGHKLPVDLRLIHIYKHFDKSVRYITHAETIRDINRIITDKKWKAAAEKALGKDVYQQIQPSLKHVANPHIPGVDIPGKRSVNYLRGVATASNLALNTMVAMKQVFSTPSAIHDMGLGDGGGFKAYMKGMFTVLSSPAAHYNMMLEMSPYMKERLTSWERDLLRPKFNKMTPAKREIAFGNRHVTWDDVVNLGFFEIKAMDTATVMPIWWGAYQDKLNEFSSNEAEAIRHADNIVRDTQPSATALDVSSWFRKGGFFSLFNLHQTFTVGKYGQRQRTYFRAWKNKSISTLDYAWFNFMDAFLPLITINIMVAFLKSGDLTDEEEWWDIAEETVKSWLFMGIPLATSFVDAMTKGWRDPLEVPGARQVKRTAKTLGHMGQGVASIVTGEELSDKEKQTLFWGMSDIVSDLSRVPISKVTKKALEGDGFREKIFGKPFKK